MIRPLIKYFGGKHYLAQRLIECFPPRVKDYHQPFIGGGNPFLQSDRHHKETISDLNCDIVNLWRVTQNDCDSLKEALNGIPYSLKSFEHFKSRACYSDLDRAVSTFVTYRMSRAGRGQVFSWSDRLRGGQPEGINAYETAIVNLDLVSKRLKGVEILHCSALEHLERSGFFYLDPPYMLGTRSGSAYELEMSDDDHVDLMAAIRSSKNLVMISGYDSTFYNTALKNWRKVSFDIANHSSESTNKAIKTEVIWMNY